MTDSEVQRGPSIPAEVPIFDARPHYRKHKDELDAAVARVMESGRFVHGREHEAFEHEFADYCGARHGIGVANGTDAIRIALQAVGVERGDEVVTVANAGVPPVAAVVEAGARPVFVDVDPVTHTLDPARLQAAITGRTRAVLAVHLYGHPADVDAIRAVVDGRGIKLVEDCAQAHGARYRGQPVGSLGDAGAFSFYPTKNLGAFGDGGFVATNDDGIADRARLLRSYGWRRRYTSESHGFNSRLDEIQAAILRVKLRYLDDANAERRQRAHIYDERLTGVARPVARDWAEHVYHLYVIQVDERDRLKADLAEQGVGSDVHYPLPVHLQQGYTFLEERRGTLPVTEELAARVLSLPIFAELTIEQVERVAAAVSQLVSRDA